MSIFILLWRNMKWRLQNRISIAMTIIIPLIWLLLYSTVAGQTMSGLKGGNYTAFILPGICILTIFSSSGSSGVLNYIMKNCGSFYRIQISPVMRSSIVLGHMLEAVILSLFEITLLFILSLFFSVHIASGIVGLFISFLLLFLTAFFTAGLSYSLSLRLPNEEVFYTVMNTIVLPVFFVSTALFPMEQISGVLRVAVIINPFTYIINSLRCLIFDTSINWSNVLLSAGLFIMLGFFSFILALISLKKDSKQ